MTQKNLPRLMAIRTASMPFRAAGGISNLDPTQANCSSDKLAFEPPLQYQYAACIACKV